MSEEERRPAYGLGLTPEQFAAAFPFHFAVDEAFCVLQVGPTLARICPELKKGEPLGQALRSVVRHAPLNRDWVRQNMSRFFLLEHPASGLQLRGQFIETGHQSLTFLGSPWFTESSQLDDFGLRLEDFALHDPVVDLLFVLQASKTAVADAKKLTARLTEQKAVLQAANKQLLEQQDELRKLALVASRTVNAVIITDEKGRVVWVNDGFHRVTGYTLAEARGRKPGEFLQGPETDPETVQRIGQYLRRGEGFTETILNYHKDGGSYWISFEVQPLHDPDGRLTNFMAIQTDITERRRSALELTSAKEAAETANRAKSDFLATISHEIRTPLNGIIGLADILARTPLNQEQEEKLELLINSAQSLHSLIDDLLDFSKIEAGRLRMEDRVFDLGAELSGVVEVLRPAALAKNLKLETDFAVLPGNVRGDSLRLRQILSNLLSNAIKFTPSGSVLVRAETKRDGEKWRLHLSVTDSGIGIDPAARSYIFQPFTQADASVSRRFGGTGLGLAICRRLARLMDGDVTFETSSQGTTFQAHVVLGMESGRIIPRPERKGARQIRTLSVLVVDDNKTNRVVATTMLKKLVAQVATATSGEEALQMVAQENFDVLFVDMRMPGMDGLEVTRRIRAQSLPRQPLIIALTANAYDSDREQCLAAGMDGFVSKPFRLADLQAELQRLLLYEEQLPGLPGATDHAKTPDADSPQPQLPAREKFLEMMGGDETTCLEILTAARQDWETHCHTVEQTLTAGNLRQAVDGIHALRGGMGSLGALETAAALREMEKQCETGDHAAARNAWAALQPALQFYETELIRLHAEIKDTCP